MNDFCRANRETHVHRRAPSARLFALPSRAVGDRARSTAAVRLRYDFYARCELPFVAKRSTGR